MTPLQAIKAKCLDCCGGSREEVKHCAIKSCPLYVFRHKTGQGKRVLSEEHKKRLIENLAKAREVKRDRTSSS